MPGPVPNLNFQSYNPMDTAIKTALGVYGAGVQGRNAQNQNQLTQQQIKQLEMQNQMYPEMSRAEMENLQSQITKRDIETQKERMFQDWVRSQMGGGAMNTGAEAPGMAGPPMNGNQPSPMQGGGNRMGGPPSDLADQYFRKNLGIPEQTPQEKFQYDLSLNAAKQNYNKGLDIQKGTTGHITSNQAQALGISNTLPILDELIDFSAPYQLPKGVKMPWNINDQAKYDSMTANITDKLVAAYGLPKNEKSFETVEAIVRKKPLETENNYRDRLENLKSELISIHGKVGQNQLPMTETKYSQSKKGKSQENWHSEANMLGYRKGADGKWYKD